MRRLPINPKQIALIGYLALVVFFLLPWYLGVPFLRERFKLIDLLIWGPLLQAVVGGSLSWLIFRTHCFEFNSEQATYRVRGKEVWGGRWEGMRIGVGAFKAVVIDGEDREVALDVLRERFQPDNQLAVLISQLPFESDNPAPKPRWPFLLTLFSGIGLVGFGAQFTSKMQADEFIYDASTKMAVAGLVVSTVVLMWTGFLSMMAVAIRERAKRGFDLSIRMPVDMVTGVRYRYDPSVNLLERRLSLLSYHLLGGVMTAACLAAAFMSMNIRNGAFIGWLMISLGIAFQGLMHWEGIKSQRWRNVVADRFEMNHDGDLLVYRGEKIRRYRSLNRPAKTWAGNRPWGAWFVIYEDAGDVYRLDTRFLVPAADE